MTARKGPRAPKRHPDSIAWDRFERENPGLFEGSPEGVYLRNRIMRAFLAGRKRAVRVKLGRFKSGATALVDLHAARSDGGE